MKRVKLDDGLNVMVNLCELEGRNLHSGVEFEPHEVAIVRKLVRPGAVFFDVGAHIGLYTLIASRLVGPAGAVHSFEPASSTYKVLLTNLRLNRAPNVVTNPVAVGERAGEVELLVNRESGLTSLGATGRGQIVGVEQVAVLSLDEYAMTHNITQVDFLKVDVEGYEGHVLRGATKLIDRSTNLAVLCELTAKNYRPLGLSIDEVIDWMRTRGYEAWEIGPTQPALAQLGQRRPSPEAQNFVFVRPGSPVQHALTEVTGVSGER